MPPHQRKRLISLTALLTLPLLLLTGCVSRPVDPTANLARIETQISAINKNTYDVSVVDPQSNQHLDAILSSGSRSATWLPLSPSYNLQVVTVKSNKDKPGLTKIKTICDQTIQRGKHKTVVIVVADDGCHIEH